MKNNKQGLLTIIRIDMNILKYDDSKMKELFNKTYSQISHLKYEEIKPIQKELHLKYLESIKE